MAFEIKHSRCRWVATLAISALVISPMLTAIAFASAKDASIEELKERVANAGIADRPPLCLQISERQLDAADRAYLAGEPDKGQAALVEVTAFAELARDYAIQSHKHEKQSEIAIRKMARKLANLRHAVVLEDQKQIQQAIDRLEKIRDDLLAAMFPKGVKK